MNKPKYTIDTLLSHFETGEKLTFLFFWGHTNKAKESVGKQCLSQWYNAGFYVDSIHYKTAEHWMMAQKAALFNEPDLFNEIVNTDSAKKVKALGRKIKHFSSDIWDEHKYKIVVDGNTHKFTQNPELFDFLKQTDRAYLIEASPNDAIWGIGIAENNEDIDNPYLWPGQNLLGFALMEVREQLNKMAYAKALDNPMLPPWQMYPGIEQADLFWRMGKGEEYLNTFISWYGTLNATDQQIYKITYPEQARWAIYS